MIAMLRQELIRAAEYRHQHPPTDSTTSAQPGAAEPSPEPDQPEELAERNLHLEVLAQTLDRGLPLLITVERAQDIASALRLAKEFELQVWLDSAAESYLLIDDIKAAGCPVIVHPTMARSVGERENASFETAAKLLSAGIPVALQSGYESYVPKTRVVLFEAGMAAANGLEFADALGTITIQAARILGVDDRIGSLEIGKDGDLALYDGDPFEYTTHCVGVVINGEVVSNEAR
jgi:imidazolonepropionase-like amidohydrolase